MIFDFKQKEKKGGIDIFIVVSFYAVEQCDLDLEKTSEMVTFDSFEVSNIFVLPKSDLGFKPFCLLNTGATYSIQ